MILSRAHMHKLIGRPSAGSRRWMATVVGLALAASACSDSGGKAPAEAVRTAVRIAAAADPWPGEGAGDTSTQFVYPLNFNVYETLVMLAPDFSLRPGLAESWELINEGRTWRFQLRKGVKFHDGRPFTADDVLWTWDRQDRARKLTSVLNTLGAGSIRKIDNFTVDFVPSAPNLRLPEQLAHPLGAIVPKDGSFDSVPAIGTGPYRLVDYVPSQRATFERNDDYWGDEAPLARLDVRFIPEAKERVAALRAGQIDMALDVNPEGVTSIAKDRQLRVIRSEPGRHQLIYVNRKGVAPFDLGADPAVRQAVSLAIDREAYVREILESNAETGRFMAPRTMLGKSAEIVAPPVFDPDRARTILEESGWRLGEDGIRSRGDRRLSLTLAGWAEVEVTAFDLIRDQLRQVGIEILVKPVLEQSTFRALYAGSEFDLDLEVPSQNDGNPAFLPISRMYSKYPGTERFAPGGDFDAKVELALAASTPGDRQRTAADLMQFLTNETNIVIPLASMGRTYALNKDFELPEPHPSVTNQRWTDLKAAGPGGEG